MASMAQQGAAGQGGPDRRTWQAVTAPAPANGLWLKWKQIGDTVEGEFEGIAPSKLGGDVGTVLTALGPKKFSLPVSLARQLRQVPEGAPIVISYVAEQPTASGGTVKLFSVLVPSDVKLLEVEKAEESDSKHDRDPF